MDRRAFHVVDEFELRMADYCEAPFCVSTDSCTNALYLCFVLLFRGKGGQFEPEGIYLPNFTYVGVAQAARNAGFLVEFTPQSWLGEYRILGTPIVDAARWLRRDMYRSGTWTCLSFQATKHLPIGRGGAILCDSKEDADWFRRARFDGRDQLTSIFDQQEFGFGAHCYLTPPDAARGLWLLSNLPDYNEPLPGVYPDLSKARFT